jgi:branched-chain amino acid transport system substrate-binding protein
MKKAFALTISAAALALVATAFANSEQRAASTAAAGPAAADAAQIRCGRTRTIGLSAPITGPAASIGQQQQRWARYFVVRYNATHRNTKFRLVEGDSQLPNTAQAIRVAERLASNSVVLGVAGPAGSQEVRASTPPFRNGGLAFVSGSATATDLTREGTRRNFFFRVVPNDGQQGPRVAEYIRRTLRAQRVVIVDDQEEYSIGLSDSVQRILRAARLQSVRRESISAQTTDFSSLVARIPANTQVVYIPWQLAPRAQQLGRQLRAAGRRAVLFGSDGLFDPDTFRIAGSYVSFFPIDTRSRIIARYRRSHNGRSEFFGAPTYVAMDVIARAIDRACRNGDATRAEVRNNIRRTRIPRAQSLLGFAVRFTRSGDIARPANFGIYRINNRGAYIRVG